MSTWDPASPGVITYPSGRRVRGRGLRRGLPDGATPDFAVHLTGRPPTKTPWPARWVSWPDFWLPRSQSDALEALTEAWERAATQRVEVACGGGVGRTGTGLAIIAVLDGVDPSEAVAFVREHYHPRAVETPWQRRMIRALRPT